MAYPDKIYVRGLPLMLCGWNSTLTKTEEIRDDAPVYEMKHYTLYGFIPIIGILIYKNGDKWKLVRYGSYGEERSSILESTGPNLVGPWKSHHYDLENVEATISNQYSINTSVKIIAGAAAIAATCLTFL
jgi:hypothetical protein